MALAKSFTGKIALQIVGDYPKVVGTLESGDLPVAYSKFISLLNGTGAGKANAVYLATRVIAPAGGPDLVDLSGVLADVYGDLILFTKIKGLLVGSAAANVDDVVVGGAVANPCASFFGDVTDKVLVKPGGFIAMIAPTTNGYAVVPATADMLSIADSAAAGISYDLVVIGEST